MKISEIIEKFAKENQIEVKNVDNVQIQEQFLSRITRCKVGGVRIVQKGENKEEVCQFGIIIKEFPTNAEFIKTYNCDLAFSNEMLAYSKIIPNLNKYCSHPLATPKPFFVSNRLILLEDLTDLGFETINKSHGFDVETTKLALKELANFHASSIVMQQKNPNLFNEIKSELQEVTLNESLRLEEEKNVEMFIKFLQSLNNENVNFKRALKTLNEIKGEIYKKKLNLLTQRQCEFSVFNHGDLWANNILINKEKQIKFIDFQVMRCTSPATDLTYFFYVNLNQDLRVGHCDEFLEFYLVNLHENILSWCIDLRDELTIDWLKAEMKELGIFGFLSALWVLPAMSENFDSETAQNYRELSENEKITRLQSQQQRILELVYNFGKCS